MSQVKVVAQFFIQQADVESGDMMTHLRLQKLVYYSQAWHLVLQKKKLFRDRIEAWAHGPVIPNLYSIYHQRNQKLLYFFYSPAPLRLQNYFQC